jgi:hypothetical protein
MIIDLFFILPRYVEACLQIVMLESFWANGAGYLCMILRCAKRHQVSEI